MTKKNKSFYNSDYLFFQIIMVKLKKEHYKTFYSAYYHGSIGR